MKAVIDKQDKDMNKKLLRFLQQKLSLGYSLHIFPYDDNDELMYTTSLGTVKQKGL